VRLSIYDQKYFKRKDQGFLGLYEFTVKDRMALDNDTEGNLQLSVRARLISEQPVQYPLMKN